MEWGLVFVWVCKAKPTLDDCNTNPNNLISKYYSRLPGGCAGADYVRFLIGFFAVYDCHPNSIGSSVKHIKRNDGAIGSKIDFNFSPWFDGYRLVVRIVTSLIAAQTIGSAANWATQDDNISFTLYVHGYDNAIWREREVN